MLNFRHGRPTLSTRGSIALTVAAPTDRAGEVASQLASALEEIRTKCSMEGANIRECKADGVHHFTFELIVRRQSVDVTNRLGELARNFQVSGYKHSAKLQYIKGDADMDTSQRQPIFWKRWLLSMIAVYPALVVLFYLLRSMISGLPTPVSLFIVAFLLTGLNVRYILPFLNKRLKSWLGR